MSCRYPKRPRKETDPKPLRWWPSDEHRYLLLPPQVWQQATELMQREEKERRRLAHERKFGR